MAIEVMIRNHSEVSLIMLSAIKLLHPDARIPEYKTTLAAGCDIYTIEEAIVYPDEIVGLKYSDHDNKKSQLIETRFNDPQAVKCILKRNPIILRTGVAIQLNEDEEFEMRGRSGLGFNNDIVVFNGTIDADYTGEIMIKLWNLGNEPFHVTKGMRLAQGIIKKVIKKKFDPKLGFNETARGNSGFNSTGY